MPLPSNWTLITVTGTYTQRNGDAAVGRVVFTSPQVVVVDGDIIVPRHVVGTLNASGVVSVQLPSTNDPDITPTGWTWQVREDIRGLHRTYSIQVPYDGGPIDLANVVHVDPIDEVTGYLPLIGGTVTGDLIVNSTSGSTSGLPYGYGSSSNPTGLNIISSYPSDDIVGGTDGTGRINQYSYQRANINSFGEVHRIFLMRKDAKAMTAWYGPVNLYDGSRNAVAGTWKPWVWTGAHYESNAQDGNLHAHWEIEVPDEDGALQGRFEVLFANQSTGTIGLNKTKILTNLTDFIVRCSNSQAFVLSAAAGNEKPIVFSNDTDQVNRRWKLRSTSEAESGSNAGSNFHVVRYDDAGVLVDQPIIVTRSSGLVTVGGTSATASGLLVRTRLAAAKTGINSSASFAADTEGTDYAGFFKATADGTTTTAVLAVEAFSTSKRLFDLRVTGDSVSRLRVDMSAGSGSGTIVFGNGTTADTNLYRSAADTLKTDDAFHVGTTFRHLGTSLGVFNTAATTKQTVSGSRGGNAALASLLTALAAYGLVTDSSSA